MAKKAAKDGTKRGAEPKPVNLAVVKACAMFGATAGECAHAIGLSERQFFNRKSEDERFNKAWEDGRSEARMTLRRKQWEGAMAGNSTMLVWLGKQLLGQKNVIEIIPDTDAPAAYSRQDSARTRFIGYLATLANDNVGGDADADDRPSEPDVTAPA